MTRFSYQARDREGAAVDGVLEAADSSSVAALLAQTGMTPVRIMRVSAEADIFMQLRAALEALNSTVPREDLMTFCRQMHTLLRSGVPITRALAALQESSGHRGFVKILNDLRQKLEAGRELSQAMQEHTKLFDAYFRSMIRMGETTGRLDEIFLRLFEHLEFDKEMQQRVKSATRYPSFVATAIVVAIAIINVFVIPAFAAVYKSFHAQLPVMTRVLIAVSDFTVNQWPALVAILAVLVLSFRAWLRSTAGRLRWDGWMLSVPILGSLIRKALLARFARSFALALRAGLPITDALNAAMQTTDNQHVRLQLQGMRGAIDRGESVTAAARQTGVFTPIVLQMISVGEESGTVDELLTEVALAYQSDVAYELKTLSDAIEPLLIVALGMIVLVLALGVFLPMWDLGHAAMGGKSH
jgi:MSHA biogenesis protein MshG